MKLTVIACTDGNFNIHSEHDDETAAIMEFHGYCRALWGDANTNKASVKILDEQLDVYQGYSELITRNTELVE